MNFISLDFETANHSRVSICAAGLAVFEDGQLTESPYWLVRPPKGHGWFDDDFIECHGLTHLDVLDAPEFPAIAKELVGRLAGDDLVIAHYAAFDIEHLRATLSISICPNPYLIMFAPVSSPGASGRNCQTTNSARWPRTSATSLTTTTPKPMPKLPGACCWR